MLRVLLVDDDIIIRTNLKTLIEWHRNGYEICGEAANGQNAVQMLQTLSVDIVITDMSMPVMDGVALIEFMGRNYSHIKVIALSGYEDFDYVRQSMKCGAVDYILKHRLDAKTLLSVLDTARSSIQKEKQEHDRKFRIHEQFVQNREFMVKAFIQQLVNGEMTDKNIIRQNIDMLELGLETVNLAVIVAEIDGYLFLKDKFSVAELNTLLHSFSDIASGVLRDLGSAVICHIEDGKFVALFSFEKFRSDLYIYNCLVSTVDRIKTSIKRYLNITASFSISRICNEITGIHKAYKEAEMQLKDKIYKGRDNVLVETSASNMDRGLVNLDIKDEKEIIAHVKALDHQKLRESIEKIFDRITERRLNYKSIQMICAELINIVNTVAREAGIDVGDIYSNEEIPYEQIKKYETLQEMKQWILNIYEKTIGLLELLRLNYGYSENTKKTIRFIYTHFRNNISLNDAAEHIGVNSSYLSRTFKEDCGKGFVEYLNTIRVEYAKRLIENGNTRFKEIVKEAGFNNYNYFFKVFKDMIGMTPLEYQEKVRG